MLTTGISPQDQLPDLIVDEDKETIGKAQNHQVTLKETRVSGASEVASEGPELGSQ